MYRIFYAGSHLPSRVSASPEGHARKQTPRVHRTRNPTPQAYLVRLFRSQHLHEPPRSYVAFVSLTTCGAPITKDVIVEGGTDESNGKVKYTFTRSDGSQLGTQGSYDRRVRLNLFLTVNSMSDSTCAMAPSLYVPLCHDSMIRQDDREILSTTDAPGLREVGIFSTIAPRIVLSHWVSSSFSNTSGRYVCLLLALFHRLMIHALRKTYGKPV